VILIIFAVKSSDVAYFFKSGESHEGRQPLFTPPLAGWLSHWAVCQKLLLSACRAINLSVTFMSPTV